jgi:nucleoporin NUP42
MGKDDMDQLKEELQIDITIDRPMLPLSAYGIGKRAPRQLIEGDLELSMEEMRVQAYLLDAQGEAAQQLV